MKKLMIGGVLMALVAAGCVSIDKMTGEELTRKCTFVKDGYTLPYRLHAPVKCEEGVRYPLVLFLHGAGERGTDNTATLVHGVLPICRYAMKHGDAFVIAPQCPNGRKWVNQDWSAKSMKRPEAPSAEMTAVMALLRDFVATHPVDPSRVYVTGISMGGFGTWDVVPRMPGFFAAMMPICGGVDETTTALYKGGVAIRFFHGGADSVVTPEFSRRMDKALTAAGVDHGYTEYPGVNHDSWTQTYANDANLDWMFSKAQRMDRSMLQIGTYYLHSQARDEAHVKAMKEAGIDFVFGIDAKDRPALDLLQKHGVGCIATGVFPGWGGGDGSRAGQLEKLHPMDEYVEAAKGFEDHPAIWMVDIGDEPSAWEFPYYARLIPEIRRHLSKAVTPYLNLYPNYAQVAKNTDAQQKSQLGTATYAEHIAQYSAKIPLDYLSYDFYVYSARPEWQDAFYLKNFDNFKTVADACRASGRSFWFIPQVNSLFPGVHMTPNRLRYQAYLAMAFGAEVINWACWMKGWWTNNVVNSDGTVNEYEYQILKMVNRELHALGADYMRFRNTATHFVGFPLSVDLKSIGIASVEQLTVGGISDLKTKEGGELVVGEMAARDGSSAKALFVVSANDWRDAGVPERTLVFKSAKPVRVIRPSGATEVRPNANGVCELVIASSEAVLLVL